MRYLKNCPVSPIRSFSWAVGAANGTNKPDSLAVVLACHTVFKTVSTSNSFVRINKPADLAS